MAKEPVSKTGALFGLVGSNPTLSAFARRSELRSHIAIALATARGRSPLAREGELRRDKSAMKTIFADNPIFLLVFTLLALVVIWNILLHLQLWKIKKKLKVFFTGKKASDLEGVLSEEIKRLKKSESDIKKLIKSSEILEKMANRSIQKVGVVRFNPFKETGGDQSFVVALLDFQDNGLVISSLYSREGTRIYTKPIEAGQSKYPLSKEETEALKKAGAKKI